MAVLRIIRVYNLIFILTFLTVPCYSDMSPYQRGKVAAFFQNSCDTTVPNPCQHVCTDIQSGGFFCQCRHGFVINKDGMTCRGLDGENKEEEAVNNAASGSLAGGDGRNKNGNLFGGSSSSGHVQHREDNDEVLSDSSVVKIHSIDLKKGLAPLQTGSYTRRLKTDSSVVLDRDFYNIPEGGSRDLFSGGSFNIPEGGQNVPDFEHTNQWGLGLPSGQAIKSSEEALCDHIVCESNGTCVVLEAKAVCQCPLGTDGESCNRVIDLKYPKFMGTGYLALRTVFEPHKELRISLEIKPESANGLLLFSGEVSGVRPDFFSVVLEDGFVIYRFGHGANVAMLKTTTRVSLAAWNRLIITRLDTRGTVQLNAGHEEEGLYQGEFTTTSLNLTLYLGGYKDMVAINKQVVAKHSFVGCVQEMLVGTRAVDFRKIAPIGELEFGVNVGECSEHVCDEVACLNGGTCTARSADQHLCLCPLGSYGDKCQKDSPVHIPHFSGHSYLEFPGLERSVLSYTEIEIVFKPTSEDGTLFYNGYSKDWGGDFISLSLHDGHLEFRFDLGTGPAVIRSSEPLTTNVWHLVRASRTGLMGTLDIDGQIQKTGQAEGAYTQLTLLDGLYLGGHPNYDHTSRHANISRSFTGCLQKVAINKQVINLMSGAVTGVNIDPCSHPCTGRPCMNGGDCKPHLDTYMCSCPIGFGNTNCEEVQEYLPNKPMFKGESYLLYKDKETTKRVAGSRMDLQIFIRPRGQDGLLFWSGEDQNSKSARDYIALGFHAGSLLLRYNLGSGEALIGYNHSRLFDGRWHFIRVQRDKQDSYMEIDKKEIVEGSSPGGYTSLNTNKMVYLGGMPNIAEKTGGRFTSGFVGCVRGLRLATDYDVKLLGQAHSGRNVDQCRKKMFS